MVSFLGSGEAAVGSRSRMHAIALSTDQEKGIPIDFGTPRDGNHKLDRRSFMSGVRWETAFTKTVTVAASGMVFDEFFHEKDPSDAGEASPYVFEDVTRTRKMDFRLEGRISPGPRFTTILGVEYEKDRVTDVLRSNYGDTDLASSTYNRSVFAQQELRPWKHWGFSLGVRLDRNSEAGTQFNPKAAVYREFGEGAARVRAAAGRGFRVPTISEKRDVFIGNPDLLPEVAFSYEGGMDLRIARRRGRVSGTWFYQAYRELIQFDSSVPGPLGFGQLRNMGRAFSRGVEAEGSYLVASLAEAAFSYTFSDTWDGAGRKRIIGIPRHRVVTSLLLWPARPFQARADWRVESDQADAPLNGGATRRPGYARVDLYARYRWEVSNADFREVVLTGRIENLLNRKYEERIEFPAPGANFLLGVEVKI
jgi:outer membrane receptor protein involved in Fe transport